MLSRKTIVVLSFVCYVWIFAIHKVVGDVTSSPIATNNNSSSNNFTEGSTTVSTSAPTTTLAVSTGGNCTGANQTDCCVATPQQCFFCGGVNETNSSTNGSCTNVACEAGEINICLSNTTITTVNPVKSTTTTDTSPTGTTTTTDTSPTGTTTTTGTAPTGTTTTTVTAPTGTTPTVTAPTGPTTVPKSTTSTHGGEEKSSGQKFDAASFIGGIILAAGLITIAFFGLKFYKARKEQNYHTL